jgi:uncharacterized protein YggT (Ycf19 family)
MIDQVRRRRDISPGRSQLATELLLTFFALVSSVILLRTLLVMLGVTERVWIGRFIYGLTNPVTNVIGRLPGANRELWQHLTTVDFTLLALILLFMLGIIASGRDAQ